MSKAMTGYVGPIEAQTLKNAWFRQGLSTGTAPLRLYTIYSPPNHPDGTVHKTRADAQAAEEAESHA